MSDTSPCSTSSVSSQTVGELSEVEDESRKCQNLPTVFPERTEPFDLYSNDKFKTKFRVSKERFLNVLHEIEDNIQPFTSKNMSISAKNQLLLGDHFQITKSISGGIILKITHEIDFLREVSVLQWPIMNSNSRYNFYTYLFSYRQILL